MWIQITITCRERTQKTDGGTTLYGDAYLLLQNRHQRWNGIPKIKGCLAGILGASCKLILDVHFDEL